MNVQSGDRIRLVKMVDDPNPVEPGTEGTVTDAGPGIYDGETQVHVDWDNGRTLSLISPPDLFIKI